MRTFFRTHAGRLVAGVGVVLAGGTIGCWNSPTRPEQRGPQNIPKTNVNAGFQGGPGVNPYAGAGMPGPGMMSGGVPVSRQTGVPPGDPSAQVGLTSGAMGGAPAAAGSPGYFNQNTAGAGGNGQPIATNGNPGGGRAGVQPIANLGPPGGPTQDPNVRTAGGFDGRLPPPSELPLRDGTLPLQPISTQNRDEKVRYPRTSKPPEIPAETLIQPPPPPASRGRPGNLPPLPPPG